MVIIRGLDAERITVLVCNKVDGDRASVSKLVRVRVEGVSAREVRVGTGCEGNIATVG